MKKYFEKHDLFKILFIMIAFTALLTWVLTETLYDGSNLMVLGDLTVKPHAIFDSSTVGIFDLNAYLLLVLNYFSEIFIFIITTFSFYKVLSKIAPYQLIVERVASFFEDKKILFLGLNLFIYTVITSIITNYLVLFVFIPFSISILSKMKVDKISTLTSTFGGVLLGILGSTYSTNMLGVFIKNGDFSLSYGNELLTIIILALIGYIMLMSFIIMRNKKNRKYELTEDVFIGKNVKKTKYIKPTSMIILLSLFTIVTICAFIGWDSAFNINIFNKIHEFITEATIGGEGKTFISALLGTTLVKFGEWDLITISSFMVFTMIIFKFVYSIKLDDLFDNIYSGIKLSLKPVIILVLVYTVCILTMAYPVIPGVVNRINMIFNNSTLQPFGWYLSGLVTSIFNVDILYVTNMIGKLFSSFNNPSVSAVILQASYGLFGFIAPTSVILMLGLSTLDIKYKSYLKFIWKYVLSLFVVSIVIIYIIINI